LNIKVCISAFLLLFGSNVLADAAGSVKFDSTSNIVLIDSGNSIVKRCALSKTLKHVAPRFNWNKTIIILTNVDFVAVRDVEACFRGSVDPSHIPKEVGFLVDVNAEHKIYLSLDLVGVSPMAFTATVARLGETHSILDAPGIFNEKKGDEKIKEESFGYVETNPGRISPNGRFVSADGSMDCRPDAYPGVWDLILKKKVINETGCDALFKNGNLSGSGGD
jgi:hypothetical protein